MLQFRLDLKRGEPWPAYLARLEGLRLGLAVPKGWALATFLVAEVDGTHGYDLAMEQRVSLITLGVADVERSRAFYERLGWQGQEVEETVFFRIGGLALVLWGRDKLALDCGLNDEQAGGSSGVVLAHNVRSEAEVEDIIASAERAGATVTRPAARIFYGGYAGFFTDPDGHAWEIAHNPGFPLAEDGSITIPDFSSP